MASIPPPSRASRERRRGMPLWLVLSIAFHAAVIGWIATMTIRHAVRAARSEDETRLVIPPEQADRLKAYLEESNLRPLQEQARELAWLKEEIAAEREYRLEQLTAFEDRMSTNLGPRLEELVARIEQNQRQALEGEQSSLADVDKLAGMLATAREAAARDDWQGAARTAPSMVEQADAARAPQESALREQESALGLMKDAQGLAEWIPNDGIAGLWAKAMESQQSAAKALEEAGDSLERSRNAARDAAQTLANRVSEADSLKSKLASMEAEREARLARAREEAARAGENRERAAGAAKEAADRVPAADQVLKEAERVVREKKTAVRLAEESARREKKPADSSEPVQSAKSALAEAESVQKIKREELARAREASTQAAQAAKDADRLARDTRREVETASKPLSLPGNEQNVIRDAKRAAEKLAAENDAKPRLEQALAAQRAAQEAFAEAARATRALATAPLQRFERDNRETADAPVSVRNAAGVFTRAKDLEKDAAELYREARAAELAMMQSMTMDTALANTRVPVSDHAEVDEAALSADVKTAQALKRFEQAFRAADREIRGMVATATSMRDTLAASKFSRARETKGSSLDGLMDFTANLRALDGMSRESAGQARDLTAAMRAMNGDASNGGGNRLHKDQAPDGYGQGASYESPIPAGPNFRGVSGRGILPEGEPATWFFVGNWYVIGPFPNENRRNIDAVFPPESVIDLDAVYAGKDGRAVTWQYMSSDEARIVPPVDEEYAIYYAWTEIRMEEECDAWIAIGSDDRSDLWINDLPVWRSVNVLKNWNLAEGYRKVHFRKGINKILVRLENGWHSCCFSLLICTKPGIRS